MKTNLTNARVFTGESTLAGHTVVVENQHILDVVPDSEAGEADELVDLNGKTLWPGLIDLQVNGGGGVLFNDAPTEETIQRIFAAHRQLGTTALLPTLISDSAKQMKTAISATDAAILNTGNSIPGIHLEGPFLNPARKGVHAPAFLRQLDEEAIALVSSLQNGKTLLTLAPECTQPKLIRRLVDAGVIVSAGHSDASYDTVRDAMDAGLRGFTHLFNAMSPLTSREPGVVGAALEDQHSWCGVIADGVHVHWATLRLVLSAKPRGKVFLVTDAMPPVGTRDSEFQLFGQTVSRDENRLTNADGRLAGSALDMMTAVRNAVQHLHVPWEEAVRMASLYPAEFLGVETLYGRIGRGYNANMVLVDDEHNALQTWVLGSRSPV